MAGVAALGLARANGGSVPAIRVVPDPAPARLASPCGPEGAAPAGKFPKEPTAALPTLAMRPEASRSLGPRGRR